MNVHSAVPVLVGFIVLGIGGLVWLMQAGNAPGSHPTQPGLAGGPSTSGVEGGPQERQSVVSTGVASERGVATSETSGTRSDASAPRSRPPGLFVHAQDQAGERVAGASIEARNSRSVLHKGGGQLAVEGARMGEWTLTARSVGYLTAQRTVSLSPGETLDVVLQMQPTLRLSGRVLNRYGRLLSSEKIWFLKPDQSHPRSQRNANGIAFALSDNEGEFQAKQLLPGEYRLSVGGPGEALLEMVLGREMLSSSDHRVDVVLDGKASVEVVLEVPVSEEQSAKPVRVDAYGQVSAKARDKPPVELTGEALRRSRQRLPQTAGKQSGAARAPLGKRVAGPILAHPNRPVVLSGLSPGEPYTLTIVGRDGSYYRAPEAFVVTEGMLLKLYLDLPPGAWAGSGGGQVGHSRQPGTHNQFLMRQEFSAPDGPVRVPGFHWDE